MTERTAMTKPHIKNITQILRYARLHVRQSKVNPLIVEVCSDNVMPQLVMQKSNSRPLCSLRCVIAEYPNEPFPASTRYKLYNFACTYRTHNFYQYPTTVTPIGAEYVEEL